MAETIIGPGQSQQKPPSYADLQAELAAMQEDLKFYADEAAYYKQAAAGDPFKNNPQHTSRERFADRLLKQRIPTENKPVSEELYITRSSLFELMALIPSLARKDARRFIRDFEDIETLSQGGGNEQIVMTRQERLLFELQIMRSVGDAPISGMTTVGAMITDRAETDQKINMPPQRKPAGWTAFLGGGEQ